MIIVRELLIQGLRSHLEGRGEAFGARSGQAEDARPVPGDLGHLALSRLGPPHAALLVARDVLIWVAVA